jgi:hypothetical protein
VAGGPESNRRPWGYESYRWFVQNRRRNRTAHLLANEAIKQPRSDLHRSKSRLTSGSADEASHRCGCVFVFLIVEQRLITLVYLRSTSRPQQ